MPTSLYSLHPWTIVAMEASSSSVHVGSSASTPSTSIEPEPQPLVEIPLSLYWDEWSRCIGSRYQRDHLYRLGRLDSCSRQWQDLKTAMRAKFVQFKDPLECQKMMDATFYKKRTTISPTAGAIWELKEKPGWD